MGPALLQPFVLTQPPFSTHHYGAWARPAARILVSGFAVYNMQLSWPNAKKSRTARPFWIYAISLNQLMASAEVADLVESRHEGMRALGSRQITLQSAGIGGARGINLLSKKQTQLAQSPAKRLSEKFRPKKPPMVFAVARTISAARLAYVTDTRRSYLQMFPRRGARALRPASENASGAPCGVQAKARAPTLSFRGADPPISSEDQDPKQ